MSCVGTCSNKLHFTQGCPPTSVRHKTKTEKQKKRRTHIHRKRCYSSRYTLIHDLIFQARFYRRACKGTRTLSLSPMHFSRRRGDDKIILWRSFKRGRKSPTSKKLILVFAKLPAFRKRTSREKKYPVEFPVNLG